MSYERIAGVGYAVVIFLAVALIVTFAQDYFSISGIGEPNYLVAKSEYLAMTNTKATSMDDLYVMRTFFYPASYGVFVFNIDAPYKCGTTYCAKLNNVVFVNGESKRLNDWSSARVDISITSAAYSNTPSGLEAIAKISIDSDAISIQPVSQDFLTKYGTQKRIKFSICSRVPVELLGGISIYESNRLFFVSEKVESIPLVFSSGCKEYSFMVENTSILGTQKARIVPYTFGSSSVSPITNAGTTTNIEFADTELQSANVIPSKSVTSSLPLEDAETASSASFFRAFIEWFMRIFA